METTEPKTKKNKVFAIVLAVLVVAGAIWGFTKYTHGQHHEETDDAQIEADINPMIPKVSGYVSKLFVDENVHVKAGDTLVILDDRDLSLKVLQANAALANAQANLASIQAGSITSRENVLSAQSTLGAAEGSIEIAKVKAKRAQQDFKRYEELIKTNSITMQQFEQAQAERDAAQRQLEVAKLQREAVYRETSSRKAQSGVSGKNIALAETMVEQREADLKFTKLQLSYAYITAPSAGIISKKNVQLGQFVQAGQSLFALVTEKQKWVVANFKETQLSKMKPGLLVEIEVDALPGETFNGKIESLSPATGARFALLPPDNSSGNFVKVVQRVPVKILITENAEQVNKLRAGMNVVVDVHLD